jgi:hypothetical protein
MLLFDDVEVAICLCIVLVVAFNSSVGLCEHVSCVPTRLIIYFNIVRWRALVIYVLAGMWCGVDACHMAAVYVDIGGKISLSMD